ncbi:right-handed parallel beta-helix repeat-containing protein, partial [Candidatus Pacearchaeota archaeon]|nr:right-handed parallel beta-helix repeat-containing protein [Candidatus Pacearchaeota archaeon]
MRRAHLARTRISDYHKRIQECEKRKKEHISYLQKLKDRVLEREILYEEYKRIIDEFHNGRTIPAWIEYYESYASECWKRIKEEEKTLKKNKFFTIVASFLAISFLILFILFGAPTIIGFITKKAVETVSFSESLNLSTSVSETFEWKPENSGQLNSLKVSGLFEGSGNIKVYLDDLLILDSSKLSSSQLTPVQYPNSSEKGSNLITGFSLESNPSTDASNSEITENTQADTSQSTTNTQAGASEDREVGPSQQEPLPESNNPVEEVQTDIEPSIQNPNISNQTSGEQYQFNPVNGTEDQSPQIQINETLLNETISNHTSQNETITNETTIPKEKIPQNDTIIRPETNKYQFNNICEETCDLSNYELNNTSYKIRIEIENSSIFLEKIDYEIIKEKVKEKKIEKKEFIRNLTLDKIEKKGKADILTYKEKIRINQKVKWKKRIDSTTSENLSIEIPNLAENITIYKIMKSIDKENLITEENTDKKSLDIEISDENDAYEIEYETPAPEIKEEDFARGRKIVHVSAPDELNYTDILSFTNISEIIKIGEENKIKLKWVENNSLIDFVAIDTDNNSLIDYIEWTIPHLSNQTFEIILITKAEHLDENRTFISDIYDYVKSLDGNWSEPIPSSHYIRVVFEIPLSNNRDITLFPRITNGTPIINVYELNKNNTVAEFNNLINNSYNKVYLTNLTEDQDTFDLQITNGTIELDHIIDPIEVNGGFVVYGEGTVSTPRFRNWTGSNFSSVEETAPDLGSGSTIQWVIVKSSTTRNVSAVGILDDDGDILLNVRNNTNGTYINAWLDVAALGTTNDAFRGFDISLEENTGDFIAVYEKDTTADRVIYYRTWTGTEWSGESNINLPAAVAAEAQLFVSLERRQNSTSNEIIFASAGTSDDITIGRWNGDAMVNVTNITLAAAAIDEERFSIAWMQRGDAMVAWGEGTTNANYAIWSRIGQNWSISTLLENRGAVIQQVKLCADPTSDYIGTILGPDSAGDLRTMMWNGTAWLKNAPVEETVTENVATKNAYCAWTTNSSIALFGYIDSNALSIRYFQYNRTSGRDGNWTCPRTNNNVSTLDGASSSTGPCEAGEVNLTDDVEVLRFFSDPYSQQILVMGISLLATGEDLGFRMFNGSALKGVAGLEASLSTSSMEPVDFDFHRFVSTVSDQTPPTISIVTPTNNSIFQTKDVNVNYTVSDETALDSCKYTNTTGVVNYTITCGENLTSLHWLVGINNITVYAKDTAGNENGAAITFNLTVVDSCAILNQEGATYRQLVNILSASGASCINITASNVTIDGNGYSIRDNTFNAVGIYSRNTRNTTIRNTNVSVGGYGIYLEIVNSSKIYNNSINSTNWTAYGIYLNSFSQFNNVSANIVNTNGTSAYGILINTNSMNNSIVGNIINASGNLSRGIVLQTNANNNTISFNNINTSGNFTNQHGISISNSLFNNITSNTIYTVGTTNSYGIYLSSGTNYSNVFRNNITTYGQSGYGIIIQTNSMNNSIIKNIINTTGNTGAGIYIVTTTNNNTIYSNNINTSGSNGYGIRVDSSLFSNITSNNIRTNGSSAVAIFLFVGTNYTTVIGNKITTLGTTGRGIDTRNRDHNNTIIDNIINTTLTGQAIFLQNSSNFTIANNIISTLSNSIDSIFIEGDSDYNLISNNNITFSFRDAIRLKSVEATGGGYYPENNNITNNILTNIAGYDLNLFNESINGTILQNQLIGNYSFNDKGARVKIINTSYGEIDFLRPINGSGLNFSNVIIISNTSAFVNTTDGDFNAGLNRSANITFYGVKTLTTPTILRDGVACPTTICANFSVGQAKSSFNVTGWSNYTIEEAPAGNTAPNITFVTNVSIDNTYNPAEYTYVNITFNFTAWDADGATDLVNASAWGNFTGSGLPVRENLTCRQINTYGDPVNYANYTCIISMWYFDPAGTWNISVSINDTGNLMAINSTFNFTYNTLTAFKMSPTSITFNSINPGATNTTSNNDPILLNNTGNVNIAAGAIQVNATDLLGETDNTRGIYAGNITVANNTLPANAECDFTGNN